MTLRSSLGKLWGPKPYLMRWIYLQIVRPMFTFGALFWGQAVKTDTIRHYKGYNLWLFGLLAISVRVHLLKAFLL